MSEATLTLTDLPDGNITVSVNYGLDIDRGSKAHNMATVLLESVLSSSQTFKQIEDTVPELDVEPSRIITPGV